MNGFREMLETVSMLFLAVVVATMICIGVARQNTWHQVSLIKVQAETSRWWDIVEDHCPDGMNMQDYCTIIRDMNNDKLLTGQVVLVPVMRRGNR